MAEYYRCMGLTDSCIQCFQLAVDKGDTLCQYDASRNLFYLCDRLGYRDTAYKYASEYVDVSSNYDLGRRQELAATANNQYQYYKEKREEEQLREENEKIRMRQWISVLAIVVAVFLMSVILLYRKYKRIVSLNAIYDSFVIQDGKRVPDSEQRKIEEDILKSSCDKRIGILLCLYTGMRIGELMALRWCDIDFDRCVITVNATCRDGFLDGRVIKIIDLPKTATSKRAIPVPHQIMPYLRELKKRGNCEFVINNNGNIISVRGYQKSFSVLLKRLQIAHKGFHSLRHTFATRALECGMDVKTLADILGHKNPNITLNRYAHSMMEHKIAMMNRVGRLLQ